MVSALTVKDHTDPTDMNLKERLAHHHQRGDFVTGDDGYVIFWPTGSGRGGYDAVDLRDVADELDRLNHDWHQTVMNDPAIGPVGKPTEALKDIADLLGDDLDGWAGEVLDEGD